MTHCKVTSSFHVTRTAHERRNSSPNFTTTSTGGLLASTGLTRISSSIACRPQVRGHDKKISHNYLTPWSLKRRGHGSPVVKVAESCHEFETSTTEDPPCRGVIPVKSIECSRWCGMLVRRGGGASSGVVLIT
ncbi:hypothetical protein TNCV_3679491 [Trichonephila clavipes]|nr:hypothetical protein TNCV_3679491 [Trichonephila clavipes]